MSSSNTGSLEQMSKKTMHDKCGTVDCCGLCDTANIIVGDTPDTSTLETLRKAYPRFDEYGNYGENNPPVGARKNYE